MNELARQLRWLIGIRLVVITSVVLSYGLLQIMPHSLAPETVPVGPPPPELMSEMELTADQLLVIAPHLLADAELVSEGKFPALGICINEPEARFDWHRDYSSGRVWPRVRFNRIEFMEGDGSDVKYPWELSRMYWIAWLGKAYWVTSNPAWGRDFVRLIDDWRTENPFNVGVNWSMPMEVAIRSRRGRRSSGPRPGWTPGARRCPTRW